MSHKRFSERSDIRANDPEHATCPEQTIADAALAEICTQAQLFIGHWESDDSAAERLAAMAAKEKFIRARDTVERALCSVTMLSDFVESFPEFYPHDAAISEGDTAAHLVEFRNQSKAILLSIRGEVREARGPVQAARPFQERATDWARECFGVADASDRQMRNHRFYEESTELVQSCGMTKSDAHALVEYVYSRPVGEPSQEIGGVMLTLSTLCSANAIALGHAAEAELSRVWTMVDRVRLKHAMKPKGSPLPVHMKLPNVPDPDAWREAIGEWLALNSERSEESFHEIVNLANARMNSACCVTTQNEGTHRS